MRAFHLTIAAATAGLLLAAGSASATPLATTASPTGVAPLAAAIEPVHYRRHHAVRRHYRPHYRAPVVTFGLAPAFRPHYAYPYHYTYNPYYAPRHHYAYPYAYGPTFSFGFHLR